MQLPVPFNAYDYDPTQGGQVCFPLADYRVEITAAEPVVVKNDASSGYLELTLTVTDGDARGLTQKDRLNMFNKSEVAKKIAHQQFAAYCLAIGRPYVQDTAQILGGRLIATIGPQDDNPKYSEVKVVKLLDGSLPTKQAAPGQAAAAPTGPPAPPPGFGPPPPPTAPPQQAPPLSGQTAFAAPVQQQPFAAPAPPPFAQPAPGPPVPASAPTAPQWGMQQPGAPPAPVTRPPWATQ